MKILLASAFAAMALGACASVDPQGANVAGRVSGVYLKVADSLLYATDSTPAQLRSDAERWAEVEYSRPGSEAGVVEAKLPASEPEVEVGDVVEVRLAHEANPRFFPVKEISRVTRVVAKSRAILAHDYARRPSAE